MSNPFFSIIIPTYNRADFITKSVQSVLQQSFQDFEIIIVDDGSTDNTKELISKISDTRLTYYYKENEERGASRNFGIRKAKGKYITFLDSDDVLHSNHFDSAFTFIKANNPIIFHQQYEVVSGLNNNLIKIKIPIKQALIKGNPLSCMGVFIKREFALENQFIEDRKISGSEDYELWLRYASKFPFEYNPICTSSLIVHEGRSVFNIDIDKLIERKLSMLDYAFEDKDVLSAYQNHKSEMYANAYSYIALHITIAKMNKRKALNYLLKSIKTYPLSFFQKRTLAIIKHLLN